MVSLKFRRNYESGYRSPMSPLFLNEAPGVDEYKEKQMFKPFPNAALISVEAN